MNTIYADPRQGDRVMADNLNLKQEFEKMGLDIEQVIEPCPQSPHRLNARLREWKRWVRAYHKYRTRKSMEKHGYLYPPLEMGINPDSDWLIFQRWMKKEPLTWNLKEEIKRFQPPEELDDEQVLSALNELETMLAERHACFDVMPGVPARVSYKFLRDHLREATFQHTDPMTTTHIGCDGYCPDCCQQPYCDIGRDSDWGEDD